VRLTGTGHAGIRIDTAAGSILCDPWVNPAYFASWFPFPDNSRLDWDALGQTDYLFISHLHRDHCDPQHLRRFVSKTAAVLLPEYPTTELEDELRGLGFRSFVRTRSNEPVALGGGLSIMIQSLTSPTDGPVGDSALWVEHAGVRLLNQNDARPADLAEFARLGHVHAHLLQFSGAIWYPVVYEMPPDAKNAAARTKRARQVDRTTRYIDDLGASWVFPIAGPPCFLDDDLWALNDLDGSDANIFMDQQAFIEHYRGLGYDNGVILLPGTVAEISDETCAVTHPVNDVGDFFAHKEAHLLAYRERQRAVIQTERASWRHPEIEVLAELKRRIEPLLAQAVYIADRIADPVRLDLVEHLDRASGKASGESGASEPVESILIDFAGKQVRRYSGEDVGYWFTTERALVENLLFTGEVDWVNSLFLSCRFSAKRVGQYNEAVFTFFKCLSAERLQYADGWYAEQQVDGEEITLDGWVVQRRCPHLKADLTRFGMIDGDVLTCQMHGWQFDLETGACVTSADHQIRARRAH
jgi:UDP-MurNAc hydroxylase